MSRPLGVTVSNQNLQVVTADPAGQLAEQGVQVGDRIAAAGDDAVKSLDAIKSVLQEHQQMAEPTLLLTLMRKVRPSLTVVSLQFRLQLSLQFSLQFSLQICFLFLR